jgi:hypothetical protein
LHFFAVLQATCTLSNWRKHVQYRWMRAGKKWMHSIYLERACNCSVLNWSGASSLRRTWMALFKSRSSSSSRYFCRRSRNLSSTVWALSLSCNEGNRSSTFSQSPWRTPCRNCMTGGDSRRNPDSFSRAVAEVLVPKRYWK